MTSRLRSRGKGWIIWIRRDQYAADSRIGKYDFFSGCSLYAALIVLYLKVQKSVCFGD